MRKAAIERYEVVLESAPGDAIVRFNYGMALEQIGRAEDAAEQYDRVLSIDPGHARARQRLARVRATLPPR